MKSRRELNVEATRFALLTAARKQFAHVGYSRAEIGQIAAQARVTTGAVYHHFGSKKGLFLAVAERLEAEILASARKARIPGSVFAPASKNSSTSVLLLTSSASFLSKRLRSLAPKLGVRSN